MGLRNWAAERVAGAESTLGVAGPVLWSVAGLLVVVALYAASSVGGSEAFVTSMFALAAMVGLGTAPVWMVRVAVRRHRRRHADLRADAQDLRGQVEAAYVEGKIDKAEFTATDARLDKIRRGQTDGALAAAAQYSLRGTGWALLAGGLIASLGAAATGALLWEDQEYGEAHGLDAWIDAAFTVAGICLVAGVGFAVLFWVAGAVVTKQAAALRDEDAEHLRQTRAAVLDTRRSTGTAD